MRHNAPNPDVDVDVELADPYTHKGRTRSGSIARSIRHELRVTQPSPWSSLAASILAAEAVNTTYNHTACTLARRSDSICANRCSYVRLARPRCQCHCKVFLPVPCLKYVRSTYTARGFRVVCRVHRTCMQDYKTKWNLDFTP